MRTPFGRKSSLVTMRKALSIPIALIGCIPFAIASVVALLVFTVYGSYKGIRTAIEAKPKA